MSAEAEEIRRAFRSYCEGRGFRELSWEAKLYLRGCWSEANRRADEPFLALLAAEMHDHDGEDKIGPFLHEAIEND